MLRALLFVLLPMVAVVYVTAAPRLFDMPDIPERTLMVEAGENITLGCPGVTDMSLVMQLEWWANDNKLVQYVDAGTTVWENRGRITLRKDNYALEIHPVSSEDNGRYRCLVNSRPRPESYIKLLVQDIPDPPGRPLIMGFTSRTVNLSWAPPSDSHNTPVTHYLIHIRLGEKGLWDVRNAISTEDNRTHHQIFGLLPFNVYSFRVFAVNKLGRSRPSVESYYMVTLREVPNGKPVIKAAHNISSTSVLISWRPPPRETIHGEFLGYRLEYRPRDQGPETIRETYIRDANVNSHVITDLEVYTQYRVSLQVFNPEGLGPSTTVIVMTDEGVPSQPRNVSVLRVTSNSLRLTWDPPEKPNGLITGYRIYYMHANYTEVQTMRNATSKIEFDLTRLKPFTDYKIWLRAFTAKFEGQPSAAIYHKTDVKGPSAPRLLNVSCHSYDTIYLQWERPTEFYNTIDYYYVLIRDELSSEFKEIMTQTSKEHLETVMMIPNLTTNTIYEIKIKGASYSIFDKDQILGGEESESKKVLIRPHCDKMHTFLEEAVEELSPGVIAGLVCVGCSLVLTAIGFILWRKCFHVNYYYLDDPPRVTPTLVDWDAQTEQKTAVPIELFAKHVLSLHADGDIGFSKEYEAIQASSSQEEYTSEHSLHPDNKQKNRYLNILAYDHSRVQLLPVPGQKKSVDYVNANYIDGFQKARAYIGTQGPLPSTFDCFWRMVWEQRVVIIVMITNLVERGRRKCDMYWPKEGIETYGVIQVKLVKEDIMATYTIRTLQIRHLRLKKKKHSLCERLVYQYHYTNWPDHGTPDHPLPVLSFVKKSSAANPPEAGPIIVHCSAGVGRTGTYIVLDAMLKQIRAKREVNIFGFLRHIRTQRNFLVQTEEQYIFIHDALIEAIESGETNIGQTALPQYVQQLQSCDSDDEEKPDQIEMLDLQFQLITAFQPKDFNLVSANKPCNHFKNRSCILPIESSRVHLTPKPGVDGSDYINATWFQGFHKLHEFIITQHPLPHTVHDFWQMVWDHNAQTIVMLTPTDAQDFIIYWPTENEELDCENFKVKYVDTTENGTFMTMNVVLQSLQDDYELTTRIIQCANWPHNCSPVSTVFQLIMLVQEMHLRFQNGPVVIVDRYGGTEAATFCCLMTMFKQLKFESSADLYMYAKLYHNKRPGIWRSKDDYFMMYKALACLVSNATHPPVPMSANAPPDLYLTANGHLNGFAGSTNGSSQVPARGTGDGEEQPV